ncbi:hypothetical protein K8R32_02340, partial [bacterium]|nr:hypothetical protein [bacterium]
KNQEIRLTLQLIQINLAYIAELKQAEHTITTGNNEILFLKRKFKTDYEVATVINSKEIKILFNEINLTIEKYMPYAEDLVLNINNTKLESTEKIWQDIINEEKQKKEEDKQRAEAWREKIEKEKAERLRKEEEQERKIEEERILAQREVAERERKAEKEKKLRQQKEKRRKEKARQRKIREKNRSKMFALANEGTRLSGAGKYQAALKQYREAEKLKPLKHNAIILQDNICVALIKLGQIESARVAFNKSCRLGGKDAVNANNLAYAFDKRNRHQEAIKYYKKAIMFDSKNGTFHANMSMSYYKIRKYQKAIYHLNRGIDLGENSRKSFDWLIKIYDELNDNAMKKKTEARWRRLKESGKHK